MLALILAAALRLAPGFTEDAPHRSRPFMLAQISPGRGGGGASLTVANTWSAIQTFTPGIVVPNLVPVTNVLGGVTIENNAPNNAGWLFQSSQNGILTNSYSMGFQSLAASTTGANRTMALGTYSLYSLQSGADNVAIGHSAGQTITTGTDNVFLGSSAGTSIPGAASQNVLIGSHADAAAAYVNSICIGYSCAAAGTNTATLGGTGITATYLRGTVNAPTLVVGSSSSVAAMPSTVSGALSLAAVPAASCTIYAGSAVAMGTANVGDPCFVGVSTAGTWPPSLGFPTCQVVSGTPNAAEIQICNPTAGALTPVASSVYSVRAIH